MGTRKQREKQERLWIAQTFNLSLILCKLLGAGTPRELKNRAGQVFLPTFVGSAVLGAGRLADPAALSSREPAEETIVALQHTGSPPANCWAVRPRAAR